ncbi:MAG: D-hexose-6-phosphate mutarotase [Bauldia sp.]|nr:D-hexose-6-phosphate mutarotase [Bauldia sp.]
MIVLKTKHGSATIDSYGGQVLSYVPEGGTDLLWTTSEAHLQAAKAGGKAPRGGIPVCWPWFGPHPEDKAAPVHGLARIAQWGVVNAIGDEAILAFATDGSNPFFPFRAAAELTVRLTDTALEVTLTSTNTGTAPFRLTGGLHTYLRVGDVGRVEILGLEHATSNKGDHVAGPVTIEGEVDRIYSPVTAPLRVVDHALGRVIHVANAGCTEAVVWNPGADKPDMPEGSYREMLCVEPANARDAPTLQPGERHTLSTRLWAITVGG